MPTVYIINQASHDFSNAEIFGQLQYMTSKPISRYATNKMYRVFKEALEDSTPDDYILITSLTVMNIIACGQFIKKHGKLNLLIHKTEDNSYIERRLDFSSIKGGE